jgi:hypothetical protein
LTIAFNVGTLFLPQFEKGSTATWFEERHIAQEYDLCRRYFERITTDSATQGVGSGVAISSMLAFIFLPYIMKEPPQLSP